LKPTLARGTPFGKKRGKVVAQKEEKEFRSQWYPIHESRKVTFNRGFWSKKLELFQNFTPDTG